MFVNSFPKVAVSAPDNPFKNIVNPFKNIIFGGHDFKDFAQIFDRIENIALRLCTVSLTHTRGLLGIRKNHLRAGG